MPLYYVLYAIYEATGHLSVWSFVRNVVEQIKNLTPNITLNLTLTLALTLTLCLYVSEEMTLRASELLPIYVAVGLLSLTLTHLRYACRSFYDLHAGRFSPIFL